MKKVTIFLAVLCAVLIAANTFLLYSLNVRFDSINRQFNQLQEQSARVQRSVNGQNYVQGSLDIKQKDVFTPTELAEYLNIRMEQVYDMIDVPGMRLPYICIDGEYRFGREAINDWLKRNMGESVSN